MLHVHITKNIARVNKDLQTTTILLLVVMINQVFPELICRYPDH